VELDVERLEGRKKEIELLLADPSRVSGGHRELQTLSEEFTALEARLDALLTRWEELESRR
jgi:ubiquinone biosynthesis protein UbiJ